MGNNSGGRFFDGLLVGALIGGAAVFLLGTKKGNKVLKVLSEGGFEGLSDMFQDFEEGVEEGVKNAKKDVEKRVEKDVKDIEEKITLESPKTNGVGQQSSSPKRFFRRAK